MLFRWEYCSIGNTYHTHILSRNHMFPIIVNCLRHKECKIVLTRHIRLELGTAQECRLIQFPVFLNIYALDLFLDFVASRECQFIVIHIPYSLIGLALVLVVREVLLGHISIRLKVASPANKVDMSLLSSTSKIGIRNRIVKYSEIGSIGIKYILAIYKIVRFEHSLVDKRCTFAMQAL